MWKCLTEQDGFTHSLIDSPKRWRMYHHLVYYHCTPFIALPAHPNMHGHEWKPVLKQDNQSLQAGIIVIRNTLPALCLMLTDIDIYTRGAKRCTNWQTALKLALLCENIWRNKMNANTIWQHAEELPPSTSNLQARAHASHLTHLTPFAPYIW